MPKLSYDDVVSAWQAKGYPKAAAEGIADNVMRESGGDPTNDTGDGGTSIGLYQDHDERATALKAWAKDAGKDWRDPSVQTDFADHELKTQYPALRASLMKATNRSDAESSFRRIFERPANNWEAGPLLANGRYRFSDYAMREHDPNNVVYMPPRDYLDLSPPLGQRAMNSAQGRSLRASLDSGDPIASIPSLDIEASGPTGTVTDQDGRHRALAAQEAGIDQIPVVINLTGGGNPTELVGMGGKVLPNRYPTAKAVQRTAAPDGSILGSLASAVMPSAQAAEATNPYAQFATQSPPADASANPYAQFATGTTPEPAPAAHDNMAMSLAKGAAAGLGSSVLAGQELVGKGLSAIGLSTPGEWLVNDARQGLSGLRQATAADQQAHPWVTGAGELLGASAIPGGAAARIGGNALRMGAVAGGIGGLLSPASGNGLDYAAEKAAQVGGGAALGGIIGKGAEKAVEYAAPMLRPIVDYVAGVKGPQAVQSAAAQEIFRRMAESAKSGGPTAQDMIDLLNKTPGKPMTLMDVGDPNLRSLAGRIARAPGEGSTLIQRFIADRDLNAGLRLREDVGNALGTRNAFDAADALAASRARVAGPLYAEAYDGNQSMQSPLLDHILNTPAGKAAMARARVKMGNDMELLGSSDPDLTEQARQLATGEARSLKLRTLDYVKRGLDDMIGAAQRSGERDDARILTGLKHEFVAELDRLDKTAVPEDPIAGEPAVPGAYARARAAYAGTSQTMDALETGRKFLSMDPEEIDRATAGMNDGDREFFKLGAASAIRKMIAKTGPHGNEAIKLVGSGNEQSFIRQQLRAVFPSEQALNRFMDSVMAEHRMFESGVDILGNSKTAQRRAEDLSERSAAHEGLGRMAANALRGRFLEAGFNALHAVRDWMHAPDPGLHAEMAKLLTSTGTDAQSPGMRLLQEFAGSHPETQNALRMRGVPVLAATGEQAAQQNATQ